MTTPPAEDPADLADVDDVERAGADPPAASPGGTDLEFRPDVEGLRAVAIILVVLYHCGISWMSGGFVGVDVFFVISGFLITGLLLREHERRGLVSLSGFYARRSRRILPAAMLVIIVTILVAHHFQNFIDYQVTANSTAAAGKWSSLFAANIHFADIKTSYFNMTGPPAPLTTYWSLAVEEQFYLVWPLIVLGLGFATTLVFGRTRASGLPRPSQVPMRVVVLVVATAATVCSFIWSMRANSQNATWAYFSPFTRAWELGIGAMVAAIVASVPVLRRRDPGQTLTVLKWIGVAVAWLGVGAILLSACDTTISVGVNVFPPTRALLPVLGAVAIILGGTTGLGAGWLLGYRPAPGTGVVTRSWAAYQRVNPMRLIGRVSFGWYLLHYPPMILWVGALYVTPLPVHERLLIAGITLLIAFAMYYVLEKPIRRSRYLAARPWVSIAMGLCLVAAAFCVSDLYHKGLFG